MANHKSWNFRVYSETKICALIFLEVNLRNSYHYSPHDVLTRFSAIYKYKVGERDELTEIPKKIRALADDLNYHIFPN